MTEFRLRELRERDGLSQRELGELIGCTQQTISDWETGRHVPSFDKAADVSIALGCTMDELAGLPPKEPWLAHG